MHVHYCNTTILLYIITLVTHTHTHTRAEEITMGYDKCSHSLSDKNYTEYLLTTNIQHGEP